MDAPSDKPFGRLIGDPVFGYALVISEDRLRQLVAVGWTVQDVIRCSDWSDWLNPKEVG